MPTVSANIIICSNRKTKSGQSPFSDLYHFKIMVISIELGVATHLECAPNLHLIRIRIFTRLALNMVFFYACCSLNLSQIATLESALLALFF